MADDFTYGEFAGPDEPGESSAKPAGAVRKLYGFCIGGPKAGEWVEWDGKGSGSTIQVPVKTSVPPTVRDDGTSIFHPDNTSIFTYIFVTPGGIDTTMGFWVDVEASNPLEYALNELCWAYQRDRQAREEAKSTNHLYADRITASTVPTTAISTPAIPAVLADASTAKMIPVINSLGGAAEPFVGTVKSLLERDD